MSARENKELMRRLYDDAFNGRNLALVNGLVHEGYVDHELPPGMPAGAEGTKAWLRLWIMAFPDGKVEIQDMVADDDAVATRVRFTGTHTGTLMGILPTGRPVMIEAIDIARVAAGRMTERWGLGDMMGLLMQLGVSELPSMEAELETKAEPIRWR